MMQVIKPMQVKTQSHLCQGKAYSPSDWAKDLAPMQAGAHGLGSEYLGLASDTVPLEITILHARESPEHMRHHILCSALHEDKQQSTVAIGPYHERQGEICCS